MRFFRKRAKKGKKILKKGKIFESLCKKLGQMIQFIVYCSFLISVFIWYIIRGVLKSKVSKLIFLTKEFTIDKNYIFQYQYKNKNNHNSKVSSKSEGNTFIVEPNLEILPLSLGLISSFS